MFARPPIGATTRAPVSQVISVRDISFVFVPYKTVKQCGTKKRDTSPAWTIFCSEIPYTSQNIRNQRVVAIVMYIGIRVYLNSNASHMYTSNCSKDLC